MSVNALVAIDAKNYEILGRIIAQSASRLNVMDLKIFHAPARLASPAVPFQNVTAKLTISLRINPQARPLVLDLHQSVTWTSSRNCLRWGC